MLQRILIGGGCWFAAWLFIGALNGWGRSMYGARYIPIEVTFFWLVTVGLLIWYVKGSKTKNGTHECAATDVMYCVWPHCRCDPYANTIKDILNEDKKLSSVPPPPKPTPVLKGGMPRFSVILLALLLAGCANGDRFGTHPSGSYSAEKPPSGIPRFDPRTDAPPPPNPSERRNAY